MARIQPTGELLLGLTVTSSNGRLQLASHSALTGGIAFGTHATDETIFRYGAGQIRLNGLFLSKGHTFLASGGSGANYGDIQTPADGQFAFRNGTGTAGTLSAAHASGWGLPPAPLSRASFDPTTVTLPQLAERVAALINDLHSSGGHHALLTT